MPAFSATAPGKTILFGEHAVVYGEPAIAVPVQSLRARAVVTPRVSGKSGQIRIEAPDISLSAELNDLDPDHPLRAAVRGAVSDHSLDRVPACQILVTSTIPPASGLGSSAAVSAAVIRALSGFLGLRLTDEEVSRAAFDVEKIYHGTPSGIDNSVVVFQQPVFYQKGQEIQFINIPSSFSLVIGCTGTPGNTRKAVNEVREKWLEEPDRFNKLFGEIGEITRRALNAITRGEPGDLGPFMDENHRLLQDLGVSTPELDHLAQAARKSGALGAKLSGGGLGGCLIALVNSQADAVQESLLEEGAAGVYLTTIGSPSGT